MDTDLFRFLRRIAAPRHGLRFALVVLALLVGQIVLLTQASASTDCGTTGTIVAASGGCSYTQTGSDSFTVPAGVTQVTFDTYGAQGGGASLGAVYGTANAPGGGGGEAKAVLNVTPGEVFEVNVGAYGHSEPAYQGGGGGQASDIQEGACASTLSCGLADRVVVAGGGGGGGGWGFYETPGSGGAGSGAVGQPGGLDATDGCDTGGGGAGTESAGGAGGVGEFGYGLSGAAGTLGLGGLGGQSLEGGGGGGGDGYYGGGGGGGDPANAGSYICDGGGGGGGSGYITPSAVVALAYTGVQAGNGQVLITPLTGASTSTTVASSANPATAGEAVTYTATVSPVPDGGSVVFTDGVTTITGCASQPVDTTTGEATCTVTYQTISTHSITAAYLGDASYAASSSSLTETVNAAPSTSTALASSANPAAASQQVTYTATVTPAPDAGTVAFSDGGTPIATCTAQPVDPTTGDATCSVTYTSAGDHTIVATYGGDANFPGSTSSALDEVIVPTATTTGVASSANPSALGQQVTYTATVTPAPDAGTVAFSDGGTPIAACTAQPVDPTTGIATCSPTYVVASSHPIEAAFSGDANYGASSASLTQTVNDVAPDYTTPGTYMFTVPPGWTQVTFDTYGAQGGGASLGAVYGTANAPGGGGGEAKAVLNVTPGEVFEVNVGAYGHSEPAYQGGGGGQASDIQEGACASTLSCGLADRVVVAGGGGGGGGWGFYETPGSGGAGSGAVGQPGGLDATDGCDTGGGGAGTESAGGAGGVGEFGYGLSGAAGTLGLGGLGGQSLEGGGGGGGDGYYGGGGGGGDPANAGSYICDGGGGGGGSGYITPSAVVALAYTGVQAGNGQVLIGRTQIVSIKSAAPKAATYGGRTYSIRAAGGASRNPVTFVSQTPSVCAVAGSTVSFVGVGTCSVAASQAGNQLYAPAIQAAQSFAVLQATQRVTFTSTAPVGARYGGGPYTVTAQGSASGVPVLFTSGAPSVCTVTEGKPSVPATATITIVGAGRCVVHANQAGNTDFLDAREAEQAFGVARAPQVVSFTSTPPSPAVVHGPTYDVSASVVGAGLPVVFATGSPSVCRVSGTTVSFVATGTCVVDVRVAGNALYLAGLATQQFQVS